MTNPSSHSRHRVANNRSSWKTLFLGGFFGFFLATICNNSSSWYERPFLLSFLPTLSSSSPFISASRWDTASRLLAIKDYPYVSSLANSTSVVEEDSALDDVQKVDTEKEEREEEKESDDGTIDTAVALIVLLLIVLTIAFESIKEHVEETADRNMRPIIASLFGEMTVLGFLSIFTFCITKLGVFEQLSIQLFGEEEEEALLETFEFVHYMLFLIMVFFVMSVLTLVLGAEQMEQTWATMDKACRDKEYVRVLDDLQSDVVTAGEPTSWISYLINSMLLPSCCRNRFKDYRESLSLFRGLRSEFVLERSLVHPFTPDAETNHVQENFEYGRYLGICLGHELAHVVHVNLVTWFLFALLTVIFYGLVMILHNELTAFAWVWAGTGWVFALVGNYFDYHILSLLYKLAAPPPSRNVSPTNELDALLAAGSLPAWTQIDMDEYRRNRSFLAKCLGHGSANKSVLSKQDAVYWLDREGPKLYMIIFQFQLVFTSAYISLLLLSFVQHMFQVCSWSVAAIYTVVSMLPIYFLVSRYQASAANMTIACSFGIHRRPQAISQVIRDGKMDRIILVLVIVHKLEQSVAGGFDNDQPAQPSSSSPSSSSSSDSRNRAVVGDGDEARSGALEHASKLFDSLDQSGDGKLESNEIKILLQQLGSHVSQENIDAMVRVLDCNGDGHVAREEFLAYYTQNVLTGIDIQQLAHDLFHKFDHDHSGQITLGEFKSVLDRFSVTFTVDEIGHLVNELDESDSGTVGEHEFVKLLRKHMHLFQDTTLPPLA